MAQHPASIWDSNSTTPSWYDIDERGGKPLASLSEINIDMDPTAHHGSFNGNKDLTDQEAWYYAVKAQERDELLRDKLIRRGYIKDHDYDNGNAFAAQAEAAKKTKLRETESLKKARAQGLAARDLYYEYMFANAELEALQDQSPNSDEQLSCGRLTDEDDVMEDFIDFSDDGNDVATPSDILPSTPLPVEYAESVVQIGQFNQPVGELRHSVASFAQSVNGVTCEELDLSKRSVLFTGLQFLDSRTGNAELSCYDVGVAYSKGSEEHSQQSNVYDSINPDFQFEFTSEMPDAAPIARSIRVPKSQKAKAIRTIRQQAESVVSAFACMDQPAEEPSVRLSRTPSVEFIKVVKKRRNRDSACTSDDALMSDGIELHPNNKRTRTSLHVHLKDVEVEIDATFRMTVIHDNVMDDKQESRVVSQDFFHRKPLPSPPKGYPGQFEGMLIDNRKKAVFAFQKHTPVPKSTDVRKFGTVGHPNGTFTHTAFTEDPMFYDTNFEDEDLPAKHPTRRCLNYANDMIEAASTEAMAEIRTYEEETFRREVHLECSAARLEGCGVGYWRYHQGSYSLGEYKSAGMCICWDECQCSKMCTRYGDLKCPCDGDVIVHEDD